MTMITPSYLGETIEYSSLHACRSTLEDPTSSRLSATSGSRLLRSIRYGASVSQERQVRALPVGTAGGEKTAVSDGAGMP